MTPPTKTIAVVGATGTQGSSVARTFLTLPGWYVRCLTRQPASEKALQLAEQGAELLQADLASEESLRRAFSGAHAIFVNTDFWIPYRQALDSGADALTSSQHGWDTEILHGENAARAAASVSTLERFVYSALGPIKAASGGKYAHSYHWDTKAHIVDYIETALPALSKKTSFIYIGAYVSNPFLQPKLQPDTGKYISVVPTTKDTRLPIIDTAQSTGPFVRALVEDEAPGTKLLAYDDYLSIDEIVSVWSRVIGEQVQLVCMTVQEMHDTMGIPIEVLEGPAFVGEFGYCAGVSGVIEPGQLRSRVQKRRFDDWLKDRDFRDLLGLAK
ncbi:hypothetical protein NUU61_009787 [Penicillium alfredii]|uniref:NmrA-like domain-containing protein n=1 Tax=Penicillium alfredii TaxID=1506179 RepID=A0A9W9JTT1_9EURO|nr:uncharacterized protein NUU61_009787 [Penicillium alfredii]KAJ5081523.1 hypothetical protein NUU61_009787 [Penicillium alfredii]